MHEREMSMHENEDFSPDCHNSNAHIAIWFTGMYISFLKSQLQYSYPVQFTCHG